MTDQQRELELLQQENAQLKQALEQEKVRSMNFAREAFLVDLLGKTPADRQGIPAEPAGTGA